MATLAPVVIRLCLVFIAALAIAASQTALADPGGSASIKLSNAALAATQANDTVWTLEKSGTLVGNTVVWDITATDTGTVTGHLVLQGQLTVENTGSGPATIGNIVVNLQTRDGNKWITQSSDIADATQGDAATSASIHKAGSSEGLDWFSENAASGPLAFMDASNNTVFSLVPQITIAPGELRTLLFQATFNNDVLGLPDGSAIRGEVIVSFGNASGGNSTADVDINGNGTLEADEARVRSVAARLGAKVPTAMAGNAEVTLTDTADDIATTGTVTLTAETQFDLGATGGTVTAYVDGGASGGAITNCAHLTGTSTTVSAGGFSFPVVQGIDLEACSTVDVGPARTCTPGTAGCGWQQGDMFTMDQADWDVSTVLDSFLTVYGSAGIEVGIPGATGFSMTFSSATRIRNYFPTFGTPSTLNADLLNPTTSSSGVFGGAVLALQLNVDFNDANLISGTANVRFGSLYVCNYSVSSLNGQTVDQILDLANRTLGGEATGYTPAELSTLAVLLNTSFGLGGVSSFAQANLVNGPCPTGPWQSGEMHTYSQTSWGTANNAGGMLLAMNFGTIYGATDLIVGAGKTMTFQTATAVHNYLPAVGLAGVLTGSLVNPTSSSSGELGGEVVALKINVDFSDANLLTNTTPLGDLRFCNFSTVSSLNGQTVREFLATANQILSGNSSALTPATAAGVANFVNTAFLDGNPSFFAQAVLVNGPCPTGPWQQGDVVTRSQLGWNGTTDWDSAYDSAYTATFGVVEVGIPIADGGYSMRFSSAGAIRDYLIATGTPAPLTSNLANPTSSPSGVFGGEVISLRLNVDLSVSLGGSAGVSFGSLHLCNMSDTSLNNESVQGFLDIANTLLGGGTTGHSLSDISAVAAQLNSAFSNGTVTTFAQDHLVNGPCP